MKQLWYLCLFWMVLSSIAVYTVLVMCRIETSCRQHAADRNVFNDREDFQGFDNVSGTPDGCYIVPNIVHFIRLGQPNFSFVDAVCVLAAFKNQRPDKIYFHTDSPSFYGRHWEVILSTPGINAVIEVKHISVPNQIFGQEWNNWGWMKFHASDVMRLKILMEYGGIYLDNDSYIVRSLNDFRKFEIAIGWQDERGIVPNQLLNQVIIAHKNARFLREWLLTYKDHYNASEWYYNAGIRPIKVVLSQFPELVHRVSWRFAEYLGIVEKLYLEKNGRWLDHYVIHLYVNHMKSMLVRNFSSVATYPIVFNEDNIRLYDVNFREMVYDVYPCNDTV